MDVKKEEFYQEMDEALKKLTQIVFGAETDDMEGQAMTVENTTACLRLIVDRFGTMSYAFNYIEDKFVEYFYTEGLKNRVPEVLKAQLPPNPARARHIQEVRTRLDIAFAAYYALSLIYKKDENLDQLKVLADEVVYSRAFQAYPLFYEVCSRYYKRDGRYSAALIADLNALNQLKARGIVNYGVMISYASTVCTMLEKEKPVEAEIVQRAAGYIDQAIAYSPRYSKYHYLKGKLLFYSNLNLRDPNLFAEVCKEARARVFTAIDWLDGEGSHTIEDSTLYSGLISRIDTTLQERISPDPFDDLSEEKVAGMKKKILETDPELCAPPVPRLQKGNSYIFICYCSKDYQSVYCDLVELYRRKVPFQYDKALRVGIDWSEQVSEKMEDKDCVGALFFISKNTVLSEAMEQEIRFVLQKQEQSAERQPLYFAVNLEGKTRPVDILLKAIQETSLEVLHQYHVDASRMTAFFQAFPDKKTFASKEGAPDSDVHMDSLYDSIRQTFPKLNLPKTPVI